MIYREKEVKVNPAEKWRLPLLHPGHPPRCAIPTGALKSAAHAVAPLLW